MFEKHYVCNNIVMLIIAVSGLFVSIYQEVKRNKTSEEILNNMIVWTPLLKFSGFICLLLQTLLLIFVYEVGTFEDETIGVKYIGWSIFLFTEGIEIILGFIGLFWQVEIKSDCFIYRNMLGIKKIYKFDIVNFKELRAVSRYYKIGRKLPILNISYMHDNAEVLNKAIRKHKRKQKIVEKSKI